jgi:hypothetical protein
MRPATKRGQASGKSTVDGSQMFRWALQIRPTSIEPGISHWLVTPAELI